MSKSVNNPAMPCKEKGETTSFLFVLTIYFYTFQLCSAVGLAQWPDGFSIQQHYELWPGSAAFPGKNISDFSLPKIDEIDSNFAQSSLSWTLGNVSILQRPWSSHSENEYQRDFTGKNCFRGHDAGGLALALV